MHSFLVRDGPTRLLHTLAPISTLVFSYVVLKSAIDWGFISDSHRMCPHANRKAIVLTRFVRGILTTCTL